MRLLTTLAIVIVCGSAAAYAAIAPIPATQADTAPATVSSSWHPGGKYPSTGIHRTRITVIPHRRTASNTLPECVDHDETCVLNGTACCEATDECKGKFPNTTCQAK